MLAYAANTSKAAGRAGSPKALALVLIGHAGVIAAVLTARPDLIGVRPDPPPIVINVPEDPPPPKPDPQADPQPQQPVTHDRFIPQERPIIDMEQPTTFQFDNGPTIADIGTVIGSGPTTVIDPPRHLPVKLGPRLATSEGALKPPYPLDKIRAEEEATLRLRLTIDARGRVTAVDPVGAADPSFLEAARRHILRAWRYKPATEDGVAVPTTTVISLSFRLEDV
jgi:protein TonB